MNKILIIIIAIAVIILGGYFLLRNPEQSLAPSPAIQSPPISTQEAAPSSVAEADIVAYTDAGYSPNSLRVKSGATVTFKNNSSRAMWTASGVHPSHRLYSETSLSEHCPDVSKTAFDQCAAGNEYSFTFQKSGAWKYHNHLNPSDTGTIIVE